MATVNKDFRVKNGLVVEGTSGISAGDGIASLAGGSALNLIRPINLAGSTATLRVWRTTGGDPAYELISGTDYAGGPGSASNTWWDFYTNTDNFYLRRRTGGAAGLYLTVLANGNATFSNNVTAASFIRSGGTSSQFLKADGTVDSSTYASAASPVFTGTLSIPAVKYGYTTTAAAGGTTTLTVTSTHLQFFTGTLAQTVVLPVTSTLTTGHSYEIQNNGSGTLTVNSSGGNLVTTIPGGNSYALTCIGTTLTTAADWDAEWNASNSITGTGSVALSVSPTFTGTPTLPTGTIATTQTAGNSTTAVATTAFVTTADNLKANLASPTFTGTPLSTTAAADTNTTQIATTAFVVGQASASTPTAIGTAAIGTSLRYARADHVHPSTGLALLSGSIFTGLIQGRENTGTTVATSNDTGSISIRSNSTNSASMSFHRVGNYAINMGLDTDNSFKIGGWSAVSIMMTLTPAGNLTIPGALVAATKSFDIKHPTKENMRLRYGSLEGPENGVYVRGKSKEKIIQLPDYWTGLVHEDSITVNITAIGSGTLYVKEIINNTVIVGGTAKEFFFTIYGERKDVDKITVEY